MWDEELRKTFALDIVQDQFSILNPYAAVIIPPLADAIEVYHTNPKIYFAPDDPQLGVYTEEISGELALFEERPNGDMSDVSSVGFSEEILSSTELFRELDSDIDHRVDQKIFARNRLFDMLLNDWDRHSDQWRWASFEPEDGKGKIYKPIPRDRDVALMRMTGLIPTTLKYTGDFFLYQNFSESYGNLKGLNQNSLGITRRFTNQLTKTDWQEMAAYIEDALTDSIISKAVEEYPALVFEKYGEETIEILKVRRDKLVDVSERFYQLIAGVVSVPASNKRELFEVEILNENELRLKIFKLSAKGELREQYFDRIFFADETDEIRLYGMGGNDVFTLKGEEKNPVKIRVVGGSGNDIYKDETTKRGLKRTISIYDTEQGNDIEAGKNVSLHLSDQLENVDAYHSDFKWNNTLVGFYFEYNNKDGLFLGGGPEIVRYGFRKEPASRHFLRANYAPMSGAANVRYDGTWHKFTGDWQAEFKGEFLFPQSYKYFFGLGNETIREDRDHSNNYYRARLYQYSVEPGLAIKKNILDFYAGWRLRATNVDEDPDNIVSDPAQNIPPGDFEEQWFTGLVTGIKLSDLDNSINPKQGYHLNVDGEVNVGVLNTSENFTRLESELELYFSPSLHPQVTFANRTGTAHNIGEYPFYEANTIGGISSMRGFTSRRYSGRTSFFNNTELRMELFDFYNYLVGGKFGVNGFVDTGRVWTDGENSSLWHVGYGGGIWFNVFESFLINSSISFSKDGSLFAVKAGFSF